MRHPDSNFWKVLELSKSLYSVIMLLFIHIPEQLFLLHSPYFKEKQGKPHVLKEIALWHHIRITLAKQLLTKN